MRDGIAQPAGEPGAVGFLVIPPLPLRDATTASCGVATNFYRTVLPDFTDPENSTSEVAIIEQDGNIGLSMTHLRGGIWERVQVFMMPEQGHELLGGLLEAIDRAERSRSRRPTN